MAMIEIKAACYRDEGPSGGHCSVGPVTLEVARREFLSLIGPRHGGSSTLIRMIAGLVPATSGSVLVDGSPPKVPCLTAGLVLSEPLLFGWRSVHDNLMLQADLYKLDLSEAASRARRLLAAIGLAHASDRRPGELTAADQHRVAICRALVHEPELLLMDDPLQGLDALSQENLAHDVQRLWLARPITVVLATSQISEAVFLSDRVVVLSSASPGVVWEIEVDLPRPRRLDRETTLRIAEYCGRVRTLLQAQGVLH